ncbi:hypothetical protein [Flavobacterium sp. RSP46]|nr:hypothetical protein [Flavobacterium sp. RSP46]
MSNWRNVEIGKVIDFNPSESIKKGTIAKKIPMDYRLLNNSSN